MIRERWKRRIPAIPNPWKYTENPWNPGSTIGIQRVENPPFPLDL